MKKTLLYLSAILVTLVLVFMASCTKVADEIDNTTTTAEDITRTEAYLASIFNITEDVASSDGRLNKTGSTLLPSGAKMEFKDSLFTDGDGVEYSLDFGPLPGLLCLDGVTRAGKIDVSQTKRYSETGAVVVVNVPESNQFHVNTAGGMTLVAGKATVTRVSKEELTFKIENGKAENASNGTMTFNSNKTVIHKELGADGIADDTFTATGSGDGVNTKGKSYSWVVTEPVVKEEKPNCSFPIQGIIELTTENSTYKIDFAPDANACDKKVVITLPNGTKIPKTFN